MRFQKYKYLHACGLQGWQSLSVEQESKRFKIWIRKKELSVEYLMFNGRFISWWLTVNHSWL
jgi:hypothetical protein